MPSLAGLQGTTQGAFHALGWQLGGVAQIKVSFKYLPNHPQMLHTWFVCKNLHVIIINENILCSPGRVALLARASSPQAQAVGVIPGQGTDRNQPVLHQYVEQKTCFLLSHSLPTTSQSVSNKKTTKQPRLVWLSGLSAGL